MAARQAGSGIAGVAIGFVFAFGSGVAQPPPRPAVDDKIAELTRASQREPGNAQAHLDLATAYKDLWVRADDFTARAEAEFRIALEIDARNKLAMASLAEVQLAIADSTPFITGSNERAEQLDKAEAWCRRLLEIDPSDEPALYTLGVIAWMRYDPELEAARERLGMKPDDHGPIADLDTRVDLDKRFGRIIENGIADLSRAIAIYPDDERAMMYLNWLHVARASLSDSIDDSDRELAEADQLAARGQEAAQRKDEREFARRPKRVAPEGAQSVEPIRVEEDEQAANLLQKSEPDYPVDARAAGGSDTVECWVRIGKDGRVVEVDVVNGNRTLAEAATAAVKQYVYRPAFADGRPVEVATTVTVNFDSSHQ